MNYGGLEILGAEYYLWIVCSYGDSDQLGSLALSH